MAERYKAEIGDAIARRRKELGMTQAQLATATHYQTAQTVSRWERGENLPTDLEPIASALAWTVQDLVDGIEVPRKIARSHGLPVGETPDLAGSFAGGAQLDRIEAVLGSALDGITDLTARVGSLMERVTRLEAAVAASAAPPERRKRS